MQSEARILNGMAETTWTEPAFEKVWQARIHAMAVELSQAGHFSWKEWTEAFGEEIRAAEAAGGDDPYYVAWLATLERMILERRILDPAELERFHKAWSAAFERTPHGRPIELRPDDFEAANAR
jgi:nitrile hydratase accessory protein